MTHTKSILLGATALAMFAAPQLASAQTTGAAVVFLPPPARDPNESNCIPAGGTAGYWVSNDGTRVIGASDNAGFGKECVIVWNNGTPSLVQGVHNPITLRPSGAIIDQLVQVSGDGSTLIVTSSNYADGKPAIVGSNAFFRSPALVRLSGGVTYFPSPSAGDYVTEALSNYDGTLFYLQTTNDVSDTNLFRTPTPIKEFRWSPTSGFERITLGFSPTAMDGSGNRIIGVKDNEGSARGAFEWLSGRGTVQLPFLANGPTAYAEPNDISRDGLTIVGASLDTNNRYQAVYWRGGAIVPLGFLTFDGPENPANQIVRDSRAYSVSSDGSVIIGTGTQLVNGVFDQRPWRWSVSTGMQELNFIVQNAGINLNGFVLRDALGVSDNGQYITGFAFNSAQSQGLGFVLQLAQVTQSRLIVTLRSGGVTLSSVVNQTFSTQVDGVLNGASVFSRTVAEAITGTNAQTALTDARAALQVGSGLRRVSIGAPTLISNTTSVISTTNSTVDVASGTTTSTATVNTFGPTTVATGNLGTCATAAANNINPTGCSLPGTPVTVDQGILNSNVFTNTINSVTPTTTPTVNQLISAKWQVSATAGNQFGTVHALVGPATFERGERLMGQMMAMGKGATGGTATAAASDDVTYFGGYYGGQTSIDADAAIPVARVRGRSDGLVIGVQKAISAHVRVGGAIDHGSSDYRVRDPAYPEKLDMTTTQVAAFGTWQSGRFSLDGAASIGRGTVKTTLNTPTMPAIASRDVGSWNLSAQAGYALPLGDAASLSLVVGARQSSANLKAFTEAGGPSPLRGLDKTVSRTGVHLGLEAQGTIAMGSATLTPSAYVRGVQNSGDINGSAPVVFVSTPSGPTMTALGPNVGKEAVEYGVNLDAALSNNIHLGLGYEGSNRDHATASAVRAGVSLAW